MRAMQKRMFHLARAVKISSIEMWRTYGGHTETGILLGKGV